MNHEEIEARQLIDSYLEGRLHGAEEEDFETHMIGCERCVEQIELRKAFVTGMRQFGAEDRGQAQPGRNWRPLALAASVLLAISGPLSVWSVHELGEVRREFAGLAPGDASFLVMPLVSTRGVADEAANVIELGVTPRWLVLELEGEWRSDTEYTVRVRSDAAGPVQRSRIAPGPRGVLVVGVPSTTLEPGNYAVEVSAGDAGRVQQRFALQVVRAG